jgi:hypothetical protein
MNNELKSNQSGVLKEETTAIPQALPSTNAVNLSTSDTSDTTVKARNLKDSQLTPNLQDAPNAARLIQALAGKLGDLVEWKKLTLGNGVQVYALVFPVRKWKVDPISKELQPR